MIINLIKLKTEEKIVLPTYVCKTPRVKKRSS